jgi:hypothetical protein
MNVLVKILLKLHALLLTLLESAYGFFSAMAKPYTKDLALKPSKYGIVNWLSPNLPKSPPSHFGALVASPQALRMLALGYAQRLHYGQEAIPTQG